MSATPTFLLFTAIYLAVLVYIGWRGYKSTKEDVADFFTARGTVGTVVLFFTMYATTWSAWTFLGMTGAAFAHGLGWFLLVPASGALGLTMFLLAPRVHDWAMNFKYVTPSDMFEDRFGSRGLGLLIAGIGIVGVVPYAAVQIMGIGYTFESITGGDIPFLGGTFFFLLFLAVYTIFGGFRAVAWTDTIQGIIFLVFLWIGLSMVMSADDYGGIEKAYADLASRDPSPLGLPGHAGYFVHTTWISWFVLLIPGITAYPWIIQRFYSAQSKAVIYKTAALLPLLALLTALPPIMIGLTAIVAMPGLESPDTAMPLMLTKYGGVVIGSILGLGAIAAAMSTIDSIILSMGSIVTRDIIAKYKTGLDEREMIKWARITIAGWVVVCLAIGIWRPTLIALMAKYDLQFIGLGLFVPLVVAVFWKRATATGLIAGIVAGELVGGLTAFGVWPNPFGLGLDPVFWGYIVEIPIVIVVSLAMEAPSKEHVDRFFPEDAAAGVESPPASP